MLDFFKFHLYFLGFMLLESDEVVRIGFWYKDEFVEQEFDNWNDVIDFTRKVTKI